MGPTLDDGEVSGANAILEAMAGAPLSWTAYALATAWLETNHTLHPIKVSIHAPVRGRLPMV